jgi:hypothetical protein
MNRSIRINASCGRLVGSQLALVFSFAIAIQLLSSSPSFAQTDNTIPSDLKDSTTIPLNIKDRLGKTLPSPETATIQWEVTATQEKTLRISGRIKKIKDDSSPLPPYAIRVVLATKPDAIPRWENGYSCRDSESVACFSNERGEFSVEFDRNLITPIIGETRQYKVGIATGRAVDHFVLW